MQWEVTVIFSWISPPKLFHEIIVGNYPILVEENLKNKNIHANIRLLIFLCFSYIYVVEYNSNITTENPTKTHKPQEYLSINCRKFLTGNYHFMLTYTNLVTHLNLGDHAQQTYLKIFCCA